MNIPWTLIVLVVTVSTAMAKPNTQTTYYRTTANISDITLLETASEAGIQERLAQIDIPFQFTYTDLITKQIRQYVTTGKRDAEIILGRLDIYFPIVEHYLKAYNLPDELKYLPMIESGYRLSVKSHVGASGMWQMMQTTAKYYDLTVSTYEDERSDPYASTEAAVRMLSDMYRQFGDWSLVLAAYNSGPGRVQRAIRTAGSKDFDKVKQFLPSETQAYIPKFVAAAYIANYYTNHNLNPRVPKFDLNNTRTLKVFQGVSFSELTKVSGVSSAELAVLNPAYLRGYVPANNVSGNYLLLPAQSVDAIRTYLSTKGTAIKAPAPSDKLKMTYTVVGGDSLVALAKRFKCSLEEIMVWNNLKDTDIVPNQELLLYLSKAAAFNRA
ncbi:MAG: transglycosylase SLT domain-containing protein [Bacteroidota bacterium]